MKNKPAGRQPHNQFQHRLKPVYAAVLLALSVQAAQANPVGGTVVNGSASFTTSGNTLTVTNTPGTIINWQGFSIGSSEATYFAQQSSSSTVLNRVVGNDPSNVLGRLGSNGRVFLVNPNGILFGAGAIVDVAGLVASTLNLSDTDFLAGNYHFTAVPGAANVSNAGNITAQDNGQIYLIAPNVENTGVITAPNGEILLAAGASVDLVNTNDPNLRVSITAPAGDATNIGQLIASSGSLGLFGTVVRNSGIVNADSATLQGGKIVFKASQRVEAGGTISAQGAGGGTINLLADMQDGTVNVTGTLDASAPVSGNGGYIDTSAAHVQVADTAHITTAAANGNSGTWLIDPTDFYISAADPLNGSSWMSNTTLSTSLGSGNVTIQTLASGTGNGDIFVNDGVSWLSTSNLTLNAIRNVEINAPITSGDTFANPGSLTVRADLNGTGVGTILFGGSGLVSLQGGSLAAIIKGAANLFYNPTSYTTPTDFSPKVNANLTAWMLVNDATQLQAMNTNLAAAYALGKNIDASAIANFTPVGDGTVNFTGKFNGLGHTIGNLTINNSLLADAGLFGVVGAGGVVANVGLINSSVIAGGSRVGGLVGNNAGSIYNSYVSNGIVNVPGAYGDIGGLVGNNSGTISSSYVSGGSVTGQYYRVGGLAGNNSGTIGDSYVIGTNVAITGTGAAFGSAGGLVGINSGAGSISNSYASNGSVSGGVVGGVVGYNDFYGGAVVSNTYWDTANGVLFGIGLDPSIFTGTNAGATPLSTAQMLTQASYTGFDFTNTWWMIEGNTHPFLRSEYSTNINNAHQLQLMAMNLGANYTLDADIDAAETASVTGMWSSAGFSPVGVYNPALGIYSPFTGKFDGLGHTITGLTINRPTESSVGMFGYAGGSISNVGLVAASVAGATLVGGLVGYSYATISNSYVSGGSVTGSNYGVGGLVGYNQGTIDKSYASATVVGASNAGGLVGWNYGGNISNSYVSGGSVTGTLHVGGLVGGNLGVIKNSHYNIDNVLINGANYVTLGGLYNTTVLNNSSVGQFTDWVNSGTLDIAKYSSLLPGSGTNYTINDELGMKALLGFADNAAYTFTVGTAIDLTNAPGLYIPELAADFNGNNLTISSLSVSQSFNDDLGLFGNITSGSLVSNVILSNATVAGNANIGGLAGVNHGTISNSRVNNSAVTGVSNVGGLVGYNNGAFSYNSQTGGKITGGSITGNFVNSGTVVNGTSNVGGLVGWDGGEGTIQGNTVTSTTVNGDSNVGGLVGYIQGVFSVPGVYDNNHVVTSFVNGGTIAGGLYTGGLVGWNGVPLTNSSVSGTAVTGASDVGGLVGYNDSSLRYTLKVGGNIINSSVLGGTVTGSSNVGGLVGNNAGSISISHVSGGTVTATGNNVGGLAGQNGGTNTSTGIGTISNSYVNNGTIVNGSNSVGGLVGMNNGGSLSGVPFSTSSITGSYVSGGTVNGWSNVGGIAGHNLGDIVGSHVDTSTITGGSSSSSVGGLAGYNRGNISGSYVSGGSVTGWANVGGLVGNNATASTSLGVCSSGGCISNSYVSGGLVTATGNNVGGLVGTNAGDVSVSYASGSSVVSAVSDGSGNGGGLVGINSGNITNSFVSNGTVSVGNSAIAWTLGGLVGNNSGTISNTYVSGGTVSGNTNVGGLVGSNSGSISNSYASTGVVGGSTQGGLVANNYGGPGSISASFWNTSVAGVSSGIGYDPAAYGGAVGLDSAGMMTMSNFTAAGWSISNTYGTGSIWTIYEGVTMPLLSSFLVPPVIPPLVVDVVPNVLDQIVYITDQRNKLRPEVLLLAEDVPGIATQPLPMCN